MLLQAALILIFGNDSSWGQENHQIDSMSSLVSVTPSLSASPVQARMELVGEGNQIMQPRLHHAGWGGSFHEGDATLGRDEGELMLSMLYARNLSPRTECEFSLNYIGVQRFRDWQGRVLPSDKYISVSWTADATLMAQPFSGLFERVRFGAGLSARYHAYTTTTQDGGSVNLGPAGDTLSVIAPTRGLKLYQGLMLGANIKAEYMLPLSEVIDFSLRGQIHLFFPPFVYTSSPPRRLGIGGGSIGVFLRFNW
jgi:hypothetical protein